MALHAAPFSNKQTQALDLIIGKDVTWRLVGRQEAHLHSHQTLQGGGTNKRSYAAMALPTLANVSVYQLLILPAHRLPGRIPGRFKSRPGMFRKAGSDQKNQAPHQILTGTFLCTQDLV